MKSFAFQALCALILILGLNIAAQGFVNLNFEAANVSGYSPGDSSVPVASALPGWSAAYVNATNTISASDVWYDGISLGGAIISVIDSNSPAFSPIQGRYSAFLFGGPYNSPTLYSAEISQKGLVSAGTESLLLDAYSFGAAFTVTLGGQNIDMIALQTFANYTEYGGDIPSSLAGQVATLSIAEPAPNNNPPSMLELDNLVFSSSNVPEPGTFSVTLLGFLWLAWRRSRKSLP